MGHFDKTIPVNTIIAGKFRRYNHLSALRQIFWPSLVLKNFGDSFLIVAGFFQSFVKLLIWRPDVVFTKGGYVCLPVGIAAHILGIPIVVHDSDAHPGLTNRILSLWATAVTTGAPLEYYNYPANRTSYVGIPISDEFHVFSDKEQKLAKKEWEINETRPLIVITGGGLGASRINDAVVVELKDLLKLGSVVLISGNKQYDEVNSITPQNDDSFQLHAFISHGMASLLGAADVVIARAGATTILELASLKKPTILIPNAKLTGGHQIKNAAVYQAKNAANVLDEDKMVEDPRILVDVVQNILSNPDKSQAMAQRLASFARPNAASDVVDIILSSTK